MLKDNRLKDPNLIVQTHQVTVSPRPPNTNRESLSLRTCDTKLEPNVHIQNVKTNVVPKDTRELIVPNAMKERFILRVAMSASGRMTHFTMIE
jgi:hypothetical protein